MSYCGGGEVRRAKGEEGEREESTVNCEYRYISKSSESRYLENIESQTYVLYFSYHKPIVTIVPI